MAAISAGLLLLLWLLRLSTAAEYKLCATSEHEPLCKWIEASREEISCVKVSDSVDCLLKMQKNQADFGSFYPEEAFLAARFLGDAAVVLAEVRHPDRAEMPFSFETVAVVRNTLLGGLSALKGLTYCHPGFSKAQYWSDRVLKAFEAKVLHHFHQHDNCNSPTRSAFEDDLYQLSSTFTKACRPGTWAVSDWWDKRLKREYHSLCSQCEHPSSCSYDSKGNKGKHSDALRCLTLHGGNVTYTALEFVKEYFDLDSEEINFNAEHKTPSRYNFLCPDGSTNPLTAPNPCSWIKQPWTSIIAINSNDIKQNLRQWLEANSSVTWTNHLRTILTRGRGVVTFLDKPLSVADFIRRGRTIPSPKDDSCRQPITWCVIGHTEKKKCEYISTAALTHGLPTHLQCLEATSKVDCLRKIRSGKADVVYIDTDLGYISRRVHNLTASAYLETQRTANYYGVVVVKKNSVKKLKELKGKRGCFPQYNGLGWLTYIEVLRYLSAIPSRSCSGGRRIWGYFAQTCAPGAKDPDMNPDWRKVPESLCKGCQNATEGTSCEATPANPYFGEIGALRCLHNGNGDVAFLDFHTAQKYLASGRGGNSPSAFNIEDFRILCKDGSLETFNLTSPEKCSFTQLNGGEVVTRDDLDSVRRNDISQTLIELDDLFGTTSRSYNPVLRMFEPFDDVPNVMFKESAVSLVSVSETQNSFVNNYVKLLSNLENCQDDSGSSLLVPSLFAVVFSVFFILNQQ